MASSVDLYTLNDTELHGFLDTAKVVVLKGLVAEGVMTLDDADKWAASHTVVVRPKSVWRTLTSKWRDEEESTKHIYFALVQSVPDGHVR